MNFLSELALRNQSLYLFGWICLMGTIATAILIFTTSVQVLGISAYIKPFKFFLSTFIFTWSMTWYLGHLPPSPVLTVYTWTVILVLSFELFWITFKASIGEMSHFNISSSFNAFMFSLMGIAISLMTLYTLYIGILFFKPHPDLRISYLWGIRLGIIGFVIFAFQGGIMGAQLAHTVGAPDDGPGLPILNWSTQFGDYRIAHFAGMHALQILPIAGYFLFTNTRSILTFSIIYLSCCSVLFILAMLKIPLIRL